MPNKINLNAPKALYNPQAAFIRELEIMKHKLEIKPRKVDMMASQMAGMADLIEVQEQLKKTYIPNSKGGFVK